MSNAVAIDIGGTMLKYALVNPGGEILFESSRKTESDPTIRRGMENIRKSLSEVLAFARRENLPVSGIGAGAPGIIDNGLVIACGGNVPELEGMPLGKLLEESFALPVVVENDASLMGLAELHYGAAKGLTDIIFLTIGTGVGGAMVLNGKLYGGYQNRGGEFGHIHVASDGRRCTCGAIVCVEAMASVNALIEEYTSAGAAKDTIVDGKLIVSRYLEGEKEAVQVMKNHFEYLGRAIAGLINIFSPQKIVIGGGITGAGSFYVEEIEKSSLGKAMKETSAHTRVVAAELGNRAGFLGAAALLFDTLNSNKSNPA